MFNAAMLNSVRYLFCVSILDGVFHCKQNSTARVGFCEENRNRYVQTSESFRFLSVISSPQHCMYHRKSFFGLTSQILYFQLGVSRTANLRYAVPPCPSSLSQKHVMAGLPSLCNYHHMLSLFPQMLNLQYTRKHSPRNVSSVQTRRSCGTEGMMEV